MSEKLRSSALVIALVLVPVALLFFAANQVDSTIIVSFTVIATIVMALLVSFERTRPRARDLMPIVVLAAVAIAGRIVFAALPNFKPVTAIVIIAGIVFGRRAGLMTGMLAALGSNLFFGQGPWTPWQMYAWGLVGYLAGVLFSGGMPERDRVLPVFVYGFMACLLYGFIMDTQHVLFFVRPLSVQSALTGYIMGFPWSVVHGVATVIFLMPTLIPWGGRLDRIKRKYGLDAGEKPTLETPES